MTTFSGKDREELNLAILEYLQASKYPDTAEMFQVEA